jgi:pimeloyl-ACP methyl ester carboxylesterase
MRRVVRVLRRPISLAPALLIVLMLGGCTATTGLFFYPQTVWISTPADVPLPYEDISLRAHDGTRLHSWWLPAQGEDSGIMVLYLHGNAENISSHSRSIYWLPQQGVSVLALDYRGFGASEGQALMPDVLQDIEAAAQWLRTQHPDKQLVVLGQSIGAALAINFVARAQQQYQIQALILDAPFTGFGAVARHAMSSNLIGWLIWPFTVLVPTDWDPEDYVADITIPTLIMHSADDRVIPYKQGREIFTRMSAQRAQQGTQQGQQQDPQQVSAAPALCWLDSRGGHIASFAFADLREATFSFLQTQRCPAFTAP